MLLTQAQCMTSEGINTSLTEIKPEPTDRSEAGIFFPSGLRAQAWRRASLPCWVTPGSYLALDGENVGWGLCSQELKTLVKKIKCWRQRGFIIGYFCRSSVIFLWMQQIYLVWWRNLILGTSWHVILSCERCMCANSKLHVIFPTLDKICLLVLPLGDLKKKHGVKNSGLAFSNGVFKKMSQTTAALPAHLISPD